MHVYKAITMKRLLLFVLIVLAVQTSCEFYNTCPSDKVIGELFLTNESISNDFHKNTSVLTFNNYHNADFEAFVQNSNISYSEDQLTVRLTCSKGQRYQSYEYLDVESITRVFQSEKFEFYYVLEINAMSDNRDEQHYFDKLRIGGEIDGKSVQEINLVTSHRNIAENYLKEEINQFAEQFYYLADTMLLGKNLKDIYLSEVVGNSFWWSPSNGLIGFTIDGEPWLRSDL